MAERFSYKVKADQAGQTDYSILSAPMGDGYVQRAGNGINSRSDRWNLTARGMFGLPPQACGMIGQDIDGILGFIDRHQGYKAFQWTAPDGTDAWWYCLGVAKVKEATNVMSLQFTFNRTYTP